MKDTKQKAYYQQKAKQLKLPNAYTAALTDYLRKAKAAVVKSTNFKAQKGETLYINVSKGVYKVNKIRAILYNKGGEVLSEQSLTRTSTRPIFNFKLTNNFPTMTPLKL